jgi:UDP-glucose 4-epimerase
VSPFLCEDASVNDPAERVVVTGGAGFVGSHVADAMLARGAEVLILDDLSSGTEANVPEGAQLERLDIREADALNDAFEAFAPTTVCHLAAQASVVVSVERPEHDLDVNVRGTLNVCESARRVAAPVIYASTGGAIYGRDVPVPTLESQPPLPLAPYGASKFAGEVYVRTWGALHEIPNVSLRLGNVYGPRQSPHGEAGVVAIFADRLTNGATPTMYGFGEPTRDYVHVSDVARAFVLAAEARRAGTFNVGTAVETTVRRLFDVLAEAAGVSVEPDLQPLRAGELERSALDSSLIERELGWRAEIPVERGLAETYRTYGGG